MARIGNWIVGVFVALYAIVSVISTIHVVDFFELSNPKWLAVSLAVAFEVGAAACLAAIVILDRTSRWLVWTLFATITAMQMSGNMYYAYTHLEDFRGWVELFALTDLPAMAQKRILSVVSGGILPLVALGFIKSLVDYVRPVESAPAEPESEPAEPEPAEPEPAETIEPSGPTSGPTYVNPPRRGPM